MLECAVHCTAYHTAYCTLHAVLHNIFYSVHHTLYTSVYIAVCCVMFSLQYAIGTGKGPKQTFELVTYRLKSRPLTDPRPRSLGLDLDSTKNRAQPSHIVQWLRKWLTWQLTSNNNWVYNWIDKTTYRKIEGKNVKNYFRIDK